MILDKHSDAAMVLHESLKTWEDPGISQAGGFHSPHYLFKS